MQKGVTVFCFALLAAIVISSGCTSPGSPAVSPPVAVQTPAATPAQTSLPTQIATPETTLDITGSGSSQAHADLTDDSLFIHAFNDTGIFTDCVKLLGTCDAYVNYTNPPGYRTGCDQKLARTINLKLQQTPYPDSPTLISFRSMMMDAVGGVDGQSSDKSRLIDHLKAAAAVYSEYTGGNVTISTPASTPYYTSSPTPTQTLGYSSLTCSLTHCSGNGNVVGSVNIAQPRVYTIHMNYTGQNEFIVKLDDNQGYFSLLANEIGPYSGDKSVQLGGSSHTYNISVTANGPWVIDIS